MEILNLPQILWQAINFILLYFIIAKFIVPPTQKFLKKREEEIQSGIENAERVKKQLEEAEKLKQEVISEARTEGTTIISEMRKKADELQVKLEGEAKSIAEKKVAELVSRAEADLNKRKNDMDDEVVRLATIIVKKSLPESLSHDDQHSLLKKQLDSLKSVKI
jgi:F-type H+-transporting ATPase subunit b